MLQAAAKRDLSIELSFFRIVLAGSQRVALNAGLRYQPREQFWVDITAGQDCDGDLAPNVDFARK